MREAAFLLLEAEFVASSPSSADAISIGRSAVMGEPGCGLYRRPEFSSARA